MQLSKEQQIARDAIYGQNLVIACPGSGKTTVIMERLVKMVEEGINPSTMLNITFTKAAAEEMESRFKKLCSAPVKFSTIHSFCYRILAQEYSYSANSILKESEKYMFLIQKLIEAKIQPGEMDEMMKNMMQAISYVKNKEIPIYSYTPDFCNKKLFLSIYNAYEEYKVQLSKVDFDDMLILLRNSFKQYPDLLKKYQQIYKFITVDEFQDVNNIQAQICYMLAGKDGNLFVVGDDDQSIYRFRAADSSIMLCFKKEYPKANLLYLNTNYRSGKDIVQVAGKLIQYNQTRYTKKFLSAKSSSGKVYPLKFIDGNEQAIEVIKSIKNQYKNGKPYEDIAILYRNNNLAIPFVANLMKEEIPFYTSEVPKSHHDFIYEDIMAYYRLSKDQSRKGDLQRILNRPSRYLKADAFKQAEPTLKSCMNCCRFLQNSDSAKDKIFDLFDDIESLKAISQPKIFIDMLISMGYQEWLKNYSEYRGKSPEDDLATLKLLEEEADQFNSMEDWILFVKHYEEKLKEMKKKRKKEGVCLSTFHSAKGLEWSIVYVANCNEGVTPFAKAELPEELEEERRMFYVAATRAKDILCLCYIENMRAIHSPYLEEMGFFISPIKKDEQPIKLNERFGLGTQQVN